MPKKLEFDGAGRQPQPFRPSKKKECQNAATTVSNMISYICSVAPLNQRSPHDSRPHIEVHLNGIKVDFLIDTGASLSVISEEIYRSNIDLWKVFQLSLV